MDIKAGQDIATKTKQAGEKALGERDYRRAGLGIALITILAMLGNLRLYVGNIESRSEENSL